MTSISENEQSASTARLQALTLIGSFLLLRLLGSAFFPMITDEAYAVVVSRMPTLSYFDHPPLGFDFARFAAWLFGSEVSFVVRLPHVLLGSVSAWLLFLITRRAFGDRAGIWAVAWYSIAPFFLASSGHFVVPDGPLNFFILLTLWFVLPDLLDDDREPQARRWVLAGLSLGAALLSKYTAVLFGAGAFLVLAVTPRGRRLLTTPGPWLAGAISLVCLAPVLIWNLQNDWVSFGFQSQRAHSQSLNPANFLAVQLGQAGYLLPWIWVAMLYLVAKSLLWPKQQAERIFAILAALPILVFDAISFFSGEPLPHWSMPGFLLVYPLIGNWCAQARGRWLRLTYAGSAAFILLLSVSAVLQARTAFISRLLELDTRPGFDWTVLDWDALAADFATRGIIDDNDAYLIPASWLVGGKAGHALGPSLPVAPPVADPRHFAYMHDPRLPLRSKGYAVLAVWPDRVEAGKVELARLVSPDYVEAGQPWVVPQMSGGVAAFEIIVMPVKRR